MTNVRLGIIGLGNIGQHHAGYIMAGKVNRAELVAVSDAVPGKLERFKPLKVFADGEELIRSGLVNAVIIATPHYQHTTLGIAALRQGLHVMVEKPISAHKADAERLIAAHRQNSRAIFAGMFQLRAEPRYLRIRKLLRDGELGDLVRMSWIMTDWFRTEAYYASGGWRATWKGEGGGVLLNQCLHNLDAMQWLLGMPARVRGFCQLGRFHRIEVEDNVTAYLDTPTAPPARLSPRPARPPAPTGSRLVGARGQLVLERDRLSFTRNETDMLEFSRTAKTGFAKPEVWQADIPFENAANSHAVLMQNFINAIVEGEPLIAPGEEGIHSVELANVMLYSSLTGQTIELPLDGAAYERKLNQLIAESRLEKRVVEVVNEDFAKSFNR